MRTLTILLTGLLAASCASGASSGQRQRNVITSEEIMASQVATAYDVVQTLRPEFLRTRGVRSISSTTPETAAVYVDGVRSGFLEVLRTLPKDTVEEIRYLSATDATTLYGTGHTGGAILVRTRRR